MYPHALLHLLPHYQQVYAVQWLKYFVGEEIPGINCVDASFYTVVFSSAQALARQIGLIGRVIWLTGWVGVAGFFYVNMISQDLQKTWISNFARE